MKYSQNTANLKILRTKFNTVSLTNSEYKKAFQARMKEQIVGIISDNVELFWDGLNDAVTC